MHNGNVLKTYQIALGRKSGAKQQEGDLRTPEGAYIIYRRNARSSCHRSLHISYPNAVDRKRARRARWFPRSVTRVVTDLLPTRGPGPRR